MTRVDYKGQIQTPCLCPHMLTVQQTRTPTPSAVSRSNSIQADLKRSDPERACSHRDHDPNLYHGHEPRQEAGNCQTHRCCSATHYDRPRGQGCRRNSQAQPWSSSQAWPWPTFQAWFWPPLFACCKHRRQEFVQGCSQGLFPPRRKPRASTPFAHCQDRQEDACAVGPCRPG